MTSITKDFLSCGAELVVEPIDGVLSAAVQWLIPAGSAHDDDDAVGLAALFAEMILRGAGPLDSRAQADAFDRCGAGRSTDAGRVYLRFSATMLGSRLREALPLMASAVRTPTMAQEAFEASRALALQAIASLDDDPQQRATLGARARHFPAPFNRSGYGEIEHLRRMTRDGVASAWAGRAVPRGTVIAVAGRVDPAEVRGVLEASLEGWSGARGRPAIAGEAVRGYAHEADDANQSQIIVVHEAPPEGHPDRHRERVLSAVLSDGMSSRLFTEVREKRGLCYSVSAGYSPEREHGAVTAYVGTTPERAQEALDVLVGELRRTSTPEGRVTPDEYARAVVGLKSRIVFAGESTSARAASLAADTVRLGRPRSLAELAAAIDAVSLDDLNAYAARRALGRLTVQTVGPAALRPPE